MTTTFLFIGTRDSLNEFERIRKTIFKEKDDIVRSLIKALMEELRNRNYIVDLSLKYPDYFSASVVGWEMEYEIALKVLQYENDAPITKYKFELVNYLFSYLLSRPEVRSSFFLMRGLPLNQEEIDLTNIDEL